MPVLTPGVAARSRSPTLLVENKLAAGTWRFRLMVVDDTGLESAPAELVVQVVQRIPPVGPVVQPTDPRVQPIVLPNRPITPFRPVG